MSFSLSCDLQAGYLLMTFNGRYRGTARPQPFMTIVKGAKVTIWINLDSYTHFWLSLEQSIFPQRMFENVNQLVHIMKFVLLTPFCSPPIIPIHFFMEPFFLSPFPLQCLRCVCDPLCLNHSANKNCRNRLFKSI